VEWHLKLRSTDVCARPHINLYANANAQPYPFFNNIMPITPRKQFARKLQNRQKRGRFSPDVRRAIIQDLLNKVPIKVLTQRYSCHRNTITNTWKRYQERDDFNDRTHLGPQPRLTPRERRLLFRYIRHDPTRRWGDLQRYCEVTLGKKVSKATI
jgi:transposase-like protein